MYAALGWRVFPVHEMGSQGVCSCAEGAACGRPGKHPRVPDGVNEATNERVAIESWWTRWPRASIGVATGRASNLTVVDADASEGKPGVVNLTTISAPHGGVPGTLCANTGGGGLHLYFSHCATLPTGANVLAEAIDVRNDGGYVIAPPSLHKSGEKYAWRNPQIAELLPVPEWMLALLSQPAARRSRRGRPRKHPGFKIEKIESMLAVLDAEDRDRWLAIGTILGRLYVGSGLENDAWALYEAWASRSSKFDEDRAGNLARMREMFYEVSQAEPRAGATPLTIGSVISWAREAGWNPFGDRVQVSYDPGNELTMTEELVKSVVEAAENHHFNVMGEVRDVLRTTLPIVRYLQDAHENGNAAPETLIVRKTTSMGLLAAMIRNCVLKTNDKNGAPIALPIPISLPAMALVELSGMFPVLSGVAEWPLVGARGELIMKPRGYDASTGLFFDINERLVIDEKMKPKAAWKMLKEELFCDFPFEDDLAQAAGLGMLIGFMQRPLMKTCPAFAIIAPQPGSGKSTLVEVASLAIHGVPMAAHAWSLETEELRKAFHSLLMAKIPAVLFDNITRGSAVDSDHLSKLLTSETSTDRTLGASETRKELNTLLVTFTGNNISFVRDLSSRVIPIRLNAKEEDPLGRSFKHKDIRRYALAERAKWLSAVIAVARAGIDHEMEGASSRFEDFDELIAKPVAAVTECDIRQLLREKSDEDSEADDEARSLLTLLWRWQQRWRGRANTMPWATSEVIAAVEAKTFDDSAVKIIQRGCGSLKAWEQDAVRALSYGLRSMNGTYRYAPMVLGSTKDQHTKANQWLIKDGPDLGAAPAEQAF